jgi:hypothetical protein
MQQGKGIVLLAVFLLSFDLTTTFSSTDPLYQESPKHFTWDEILRDGLNLGLRLQLRGGAGRRTHRALVRPVLMTSALCWLKAVLDGHTST